MNFAVTIDWKFVVALGAATVGTIFAVKMDASAAERVSTHVVDACKEYALALNSERILRYRMMDWAYDLRIVCLFYWRVCMVVSKVAVCPICGKRTYMRIEDGRYLREYPIRFNCSNCRALIKGTYNMSLPGQKGVILYNANIEECDVNPHTKEILNADYVVEISGELPCAKVTPFDGKIIETTPYINASDQIDVIDWKNRLSYFVKNMEEWKAWRSIAFQLLNEGSTEYVPEALRNMMGEYSYRCDNYLKALHCLQEVVQEETKHLFHPENEDDVIVGLIAALSKIDKDKLHQFVLNKGGTDTLVSDYRKVIDVFSAFMNIYPNILPAETYMRYKKQDASLGIATCSFEDLKSFYQDTYESLLSLLYIPVCMDNILIRADYDCFDNAITGFINAPGFKGVRGTDYVKYVGMDNGKKADLINTHEPIQRILKIPVSKDLRNGIGHNNYKYDGLTQTIITFDYRKRNKEKMRTNLMDVALDCLGLARTSVIFGEILLFILRQELRTENMHSAIHPRFYKKVDRNDRCPCGSGMKYKKCCRNDIDAMKPVNGR